MHLLKSDLSIACARAAVTALWLLPTAVVMPAHVLEQACCSSIEICIAFALAQVKPACGRYQVLYAEALEGDLVLQTMQRRAAELNFDLCRRCDAFDAGQQALGIPRYSRCEPVRLPPARARS